MNIHYLFHSQTRKSFLFWWVSGSLLVYTFGKNLLQQTEPHPYFGDHRQVWCTAGLRQLHFWRISTISSLTDWMTFIGSCYCDNMFQTNVARLFVSPAELNTTREDIYTQGVSGKNAHIQRECGPELTDYLFHVTKKDHMNIFMLQRVMCWLVITICLCCE